jgi:Rhodopirellula transposase DDE domain
MIDHELIRARFVALEPHLDERSRRVFAAAEANAAGYGGIAAVWRATGIAPSTIGRALRELADGPGPLKQFERITSSTAVNETSRKVRQTYRIRQLGGGRKLTEQKDPTIITKIEQMLKDEVAGDPMTEQKWIRSSLRHLSKRLADEGYQASTFVVTRLLKKMGFSLKANKSKQGMSGCPDRDEQFEYIAFQKERFFTAALPIISIDTKKKELIGDFRNKGKTWCKQAEEVAEHDFPGAAKCRAVPFGIYDATRNEGYVYVGLSNDTPQFAVHCIARWWEGEGRRKYPGASALLVLADSGGSNGCRARAWKLSLQEKLCDDSGLAVTVCTDCSASSARTGRESH